MVIVTLAVAREHVILLDINVNNGRARAFGIDNTENYYADR